MYALHESDDVSYTEIIIKKKDWDLQNFQLYKTYECYQNIVRDLIREHGGLFGVSAGTPSILQHECFNIEFLLKSTYIQWYDPNQDPKSSLKEYTFKEKQ